MSELLAAILVGGKSRRMGTDKALVRIAGLPMVRWVAKAAETVAANVVAVGRSNPLAGIPAIPDREGARAGALAGLVSALDYASPDHVLLLAVDQPFVRPATLVKLTETLNSAPVVPVDHQTRQVVCAVYPSSLAIRAAEELERGGSIQSLLDDVSHREVAAEVWEAWGEDGRSWFSVDNNESLAEGLRRFGSPG